MFNRIMKNRIMPRKLNKYFQNVADAIAQTKKISEVFPNTSDSGQTREGILQKFLVSHLPNRCAVIKGGFIFDSNDNESSQIDLIIHNDLSLQFNSLEEYAQKSFVTIEGCYAAISVKSNLDKQQLENSLDGFSTIPSTPELKTIPAIKPGTLTKNIPLRIIFAFSGISANTIKSHMENYYKKNNTPYNEQVRLVIVNNEYIIIRTVDEGKTNTGEIIPKNTFFVAKPENIFRGGYFLHYLLTDLQSLSNLGTYSLFSHKDYLDNSLSDFD